MFWAHRAAGVRRAPLAGGQRADFGIGFGDNRRTLITLDRRAVADAPVRVRHRADLRVGFAAAACAVFPFAGCVVVDKAVAVGDAGRVNIGQTGKRARPATPAAEKAATVVVTDRVDAATRRTAIGVKCAVGLIRSVRGKCVITFVYVSSATVKNKVTRTCRTILLKVQHRGDSAEVTKQIIRPFVARRRDCDCINRCALRFDKVNDRRARSAAAASCPGSWRRRRISRRCRSCHTRLFLRRWRWLSRCSR